MKFVWLIIALGMSGLSTASASATVSELKLGLENHAFAFDIQSERFPNGEIQFTVKLTKSKGTFPARIETTLGSVQIGLLTEEEQKKHPEAPPIRSETVYPGRNVPTDRQDRIILCVFTVTKEDLENPYLSFLVTIKDSHGYPDYFYAPLKNCIKP